MVLVGFLGLDLIKNNNFPQLTEFSVSSEIFEINQSYILQKGPPVSLEMYWKHRQFDVV